jgi:hypothetical protein
MASTLDCLSRLARQNVEFVVVGGMAGTMHGSALVTEDVDVCAPLTPVNLARIVSAVSDLDPRFRMTPQRLPLPSDPGRLIGYKNLYLHTDWGQLDILSEITGIGPYEEVARRSKAVDVGGITYRVLAIDALIEAKKAIGRPKDLQAAAELEAIRARLTPPGVSQSPQ